MIRNKRTSNRYTPDEIDRMEELWEECQESLKISPKRKSEIFAQGIINHLENLLASQIPHTHTKPQSNQQQRINTIYEIIDLIKENGHKSLIDVYNSIFKGAYDCFRDVKNRTKATHFQSLLQSPDLFFLDLSKYGSNSKYPIIIIHRQSKWYPQLANYLFSVKSQLMKVTSDGIKEEKFRDRINEILIMKSRYHSNPDKAEKTMLNIFLSEIGVIEEKPIYDNTDPILQEVIRLRSLQDFREAQRLLEQEKQHKKQQKAVVETTEDSNDEGLEFLNAIGGQTK